MSLPGLREEIEKDSADDISGDQNERSHSESQQSSCGTEVASVRSIEYEKENNLTSKTSYNKGAPLDKVRSRVSIGPAEGQDPAFEVDWDGPDDPENPLNWSLGYKSMVVAMMSYCTLVTVLYSTSYTSGIPGVMESFGISETVALMGLTTFLLGLAAGSLIAAPMSEMVGRRPVYLASLALHVIFILPAALADRFEGILVPRFFGAVAAAALVSNAPGTINDIASEKYRAFVFSIWGIGPMNGPVVGPLIGGWIFQYAGWRWLNWVVMIAGGVGFCFLLFVKETYAPTILRRRARLRRQETQDPRWWSRYDEKKSALQLLKVNLSRPFVMAVTEPICIFWDIYIAIVYAILYLCFFAYPLLFSSYRAWSPGLTGLSFCGIGLGSLLLIASEPLLRRFVIDRHKPDPDTGRPPPEAQVAIICGAALLIPLGELWFAWTCTPPTHWIWPLLAGLPFAFGNTALFIYGNNYMLQSYGVYAASALAGNAVLRSVAGATLPLAGPALYGKLGPHWAGTLLGLLELACVPIPFVFYRYGARIRMRSGLIRRMQEERSRLEGRRESVVMHRLEAEVKAEPASQTGAAVGQIEVEPERKEEIVGSGDLEKGLVREIMA
ncbi:MFS multidrug transporter [Viridothelium virens]|uniref:MFS multidrug transporter n=1 Tax=Viridothelium virens TaxID=1048519 RepID=A0A6A6H7K4_VIRVR|nr:MFS multidrug transporter [Viridothelium virens]